MYETETHSFIVKIWLEMQDEVSNSADWRGHITHVPSGKQQYLTQLDDIIAFIIPYLEQMGVQVEPSPQVKQFVLWRLIRRWRKKERA